MFVGNFKVVQNNDEVDRSGILLDGEYYKKNERREGNKKNDLENTSKTESTFKTENGYAK